MTRATTLFALLSLSLAACDSGSTDKSSPDGDVSERPDSDDPGSSARTAHIVGSAAAGAESGTVSVHIAATGEVVGEGEIDASGRYIAMVEAEAESLVVQAFDASGSLQGQVLVAASGEAESTTTAAPMTSETMLEAEVYVAAEAEAEAEANGEGDAESTAMADLRARIDAEVAAAVDAAPSREDAVHALSVAILAAQETEAQAMVAFDGAAEGFDARAAVDAEVMAEVDAMLDSGLSAEEGDMWLFDAEDAAAEAHGISVEARAEAEASASLALRTTLDAMAQAGETTWAVADASAHVSAELEAHLTSMATMAVVEASAYGDTMADAALDAQAELQAELESASDREDAAEAWASFEASVVGSAEALIEPDEMEEEDASLLLWLVADLDVDTSLEVVSVVETALEASASLEAELEALRSEVGSEMSSEEMAESVVDARLAFHSEVYGSVDSEPAQLAADLVVMASGGFVAGGSAR